MFGAPCKNAGCCINSVVRINLTIPNRGSEESFVIEQIKKRDGRIVEFDSSKITAAIDKAGQATNGIQRP